MAYRLFVALDLPSAIKTDLSRLRAPIPSAAWSGVNKLHVTLRFIGDGIAEDGMIAIREALLTIGAPAFSFRLRGMGRFGHPPRVVWVGVDAPPALYELQRQIEARIVGAGFPAADQAFSPHITLARLKSPAAAGAVRALIDQHSAYTSAVIDADEFVLFASETTASGIVYRALARQVLS